MLKADEVYDIMERDYPDKFKVYFLVLLRFCYSKSVWYRVGFPENLGFGSFCFGFHSYINMGVIANYT